MKVDRNRDHQETFRDRFERILDALHARSEGRRPDVDELLAERLEPVYIQIAAIARSLSKTTEPHGRRS